MSRFFERLPLDLDGQCYFAFCKKSRRFFRPNLYDTFSHRLSNKLWNLISLGQLDRKKFTVKWVKKFQIDLHETSQRSTWLGHIFKVLDHHMLTCNSLFFQSFFTFTSNIWTFIQHLFSPRRFGQRVIESKWNRISTRKIHF